MMTIISFITSNTFNNIIKKKYTNRTKLSMKSALLALGKLVVSYSTNPVDFEVYPKFSAKTKEIADTLVKANFKRVSSSKYVYKSFKSESAHTIITNCPLSHNMVSCTCKSYVKHGVCCHSVAVSNIFSLGLFHPKYAKTVNYSKFVTKKKRGRKGGREKYGKALDKPVISPIPSVKEKKSRGRPTTRTAFTEPTIQANKRNKVVFDFEAMPENIGQRKSSRIKK